MADACKLIKIMDNAEFQCYVEDELESFTVVGYAAFLDRLLGLAFSVRPFVFKAAGCLADLLKKSACEDRAVSHVENLVLYRRTSRV